MDGPSLGYWQEPQNSSMRRMFLEERRELQNRLEEETDSIRQEMMKKIRSLWQEMVMRDNMQKEMFYDLLLMDREKRERAIKALQLYYSLVDEMREKAGAGEMLDHLEDGKMPVRLYGRAVKLQNLQNCMRTCSKESFEVEELERERKEQRRIIEGINGDAYRKDSKILEGGQLALLPKRKMGAEWRRVAEEKMREEESNREQQNSRKTRRWNRDEMTENNNREEEMERAENIKLRKAVRRLQDGRADKCLRKERAKVEKLEKEEKIWMRKERVNTRRDAEEVKCQKKDCRVRCDGKGTEQENRPYRGEEIFRKEEELFRERKQKDTVKKENEMKTDKDEMQETNDAEARAVQPDKVDTDSPLEDYSLRRKIFSEEENSLSKVKDGDECQGKEEEKEKKRRTDTENEGRNAEGPEEPETQEKIHILSERRKKVDENDNENTEAVKKPEESEDERKSDIETKDMDLDSPWDTETEEEERIRLEKKKNRQWRVEAKLQKEKCMKNPRKTVGEIDELPMTSSAEKESSEETEMEETKGAALQKPEESEDENDDERKNDVKTEEMDLDTPWDTETEEEERTRLQKKKARQVRVEERREQESQKKEKEQRKDDETVERWVDDINKELEGKKEWVMPKKKRQEKETRQKLEEGQERPLKESKKKQKGQEKRNREKEGEKNERGITSPDKRTAKHVMEQNEAPNQSIAAQEPVENEDAKNGRSKSEETDMDAPSDRGSEVEERVRLEEKKNRQRREEERIRQEQQKKESEMRRKADKNVEGWIEDIRKELEREVERMQEERRRQEKEEEEKRHMIEQRNRREERQWKERERFEKFNKEEDKQRNRELGKERWGGRMEDVNRQNMQGEKKEKCLFWAVRRTEDRKRDLHEKRMEKESEKTRKQMEDRRKREEEEKERRTEEEEKTGKEIERTACGKGRRKECGEGNEAVVADEREKKLGKEHFQSLADSKTSVSDETSYQNQQKAAEEAKKREEKRKEEYAELEKELRRRRVEEAEKPKTVAGQLKKMVTMTYRKAADHIKRYDLDNLYGQHQLEMKRLGQEREKKEETFEGAAGETEGAKQCELVASRYSTLREKDKTA